MAESILGAVLGVVFDRLASEQVLKFFKSSKLDQSLVQELKNQMNLAGKVLADAEQKQNDDTNVKVWLSDLKHLFYRAEEIADQIATEALRCSMDQQSPKRVGCVPNLIPCFSSSSSFASSVNSEISEVVCQLKEMVIRQSVVLNLREGSADVNMTVNNKNPDNMTSSYVPKDEVVFGREKEKEELLEFLFPEEADGIKNSGVTGVAIVGMGGMGKTTLAQYVYNHERLEAFDYLKAWVHVSQQFNVSQIIKSIIRSITNDQYDGSLDDLQSLHGKLIEKLGGKRFFLVLDDVWNENPKEWEYLRTPLSYGADGSKFIVTTRHNEVAKIMHTTHVIRLKGLSDEDGWSLFSKHAASANQNLESNPRKQEIGREIVLRCQGLPLAIKAIGGLLWPKDDNEWEEILQSPMWELLDNKGSVAPVLMLSYHHLPSHLKRCFSYCAIFPKGYEFDRKTLVLLWMAENFVKASDSGRRIEDIGEHYLKQLLSRSFFEGTGNFVVMHDLMHDLAEAVSGEFFERLEDKEKASQPNKKARHFSSSQEDYVEHSIRFEGLHEAKYLRTFIPLLQQKWFLQCKLSDKIPTKIITHFHCLHVLSLSGYEVFYLPESIGKLIQLRYLNVSRTFILELPQSVSTLCNLQTLLLSGCAHLKRLPEHLSRLVSIRHLELNDTKSLKQMPKHIGKLTCLQTLSDFVVSKDSGHGIEELKDLHHIRGKLALRCLQNVSSPVDASKANMSCREYINKLALEFDETDIDDSEKGRRVLENLKPHTNLERLTIQNYLGTRFPSWLLNTQCSLYEKLVNLRLIGCSYCYCLPPLGQLSSLSSLEIEGMDNITVIGSEFYYTNGSSVEAPFSALRTLNFGGMKNWKSWSGHEIEGRLPFPRLESLTLRDCPELEGGLPVNVLSLKELVFERCDRLESSVLQLSSTNHESQSLSNQRALGNPSQLASITELRLNALQQLVRLPPEVSMLSCLETLELSDCENLKSLDNVALPCNLRSLEISECKILESLPKEMDLLNNHLVKIRLWSCPCLKSGPEDTLPTSLQSLRVEWCERWEFPIPTERMERYSALDSLELSNGPLISFPLGGFPKLRDLDLGNNRDLERVYIQRGADDYVINLTSLEVLSISHCPKLKWVGKTEEEGVVDLPAPNLRGLYIRECEKVNPLLLLSGVANEEGLPSKLQSLTIDDYRKTITPHMNCRSLLMLSCLTKLWLNGYIGEYFPDNEVPLPTSITHLWLVEFPDLKRLNGEALKTLSSLRELWISNCLNLECLPEVGLPPSLGRLYIWDCPKLQCLPKVGLPPSLGRLYIRGCPKLEERCREKKGRDWPNIKHIPLIQINHKVIIL